MTLLIKDLFNIIQIYSSDFNNAKLLIDYKSSISWYGGFPVYIMGIKYPIHMYNKYIKLSDYIYNDIFNK